MTIPIVCFVGKSNSGKTTLLERLVPELVRRGHRIACLKHTHHAVDLDTAGKDTHRLRQAGAQVVGLASDAGQVLMGDWLGGDVLVQSAFMLGGSHDVLLAEGFRKSPHPKIEVFRPGLGPDLLCDPSELIAAVSDQPVAGVELRFGPDEVDSLADFVEDRFLRRDASDSVVDLLVNGAPVALNPFLRTMMERVITGVVSALKDVPDDLRDVQLRIQPVAVPAEEARS